jgi:uncharacterized membrane protein
MAELRLESDEQTGGFRGWLVRGCVALPFLVFGLEKFGNDPHWVRMFGEIGWGVWFRYFTGVLEVLGAALVMVPRLALVGFCLLAATMTSAVGIVAVVLHRPANSLFPGVFLVGVLGVGLRWWRRG